jgi:hypothetical protein
MSILQQPQLLASTTSDSTFAAGLVLTALALAMLTLALGLTVSRLRRARLNRCQPGGPGTGLPAKVRHGAGCAPPVATALE